MLPTGSIMLWLAIANLSSLSLYLIVLWFLPRSVSSDLFRYFLLSYVAFANPLLVVQLLTPEHSWMPLCSTLIHANGVFFVMLLGQFLLSIAGPQELRSWRFRFFYANFAVLLLCALFRLIEQGAEMSELGLRPRPGILHPYFTFTMLMYGAYFCWFSWNSYRRTSEQLVRHQIRALAYSAFPASVMFLTTNAIVPALTENYQITPVGSLWFLILFAGILYVLWAGRSLLVSTTVRRLAAVPLLTSSAQNLELISGCVRQAGDQIACAQRKDLQLADLRARVVLDDQPARVFERANLFTISARANPSAEQGADRILSPTTLKIQTLVAVGCLSLVSSLVFSSLLVSTQGGYFGRVSLGSFVLIFTALTLHTQRRQALLYLATLVRNIMQRKEFEEEVRCSAFRRYLEILTSALQKMASRRSRSQSLHHAELISAMDLELTPISVPTHREVLEAAES